MSTRVMSDVWDSDLGRAERGGSTMVHVMVALANEADDDGTNCFPGTRRIALRARVSERQVVRIVQDLAGGGWLWVVQRGSGAGYRTEYRLNVDRLREQAERNRAAERERRARQKGCQGVTLLRGKKRVTSGARKGDISTEKGDISASPLFVLPVLPGENPKAPPPTLTLPREGVRAVELSHALDRAVDQVCSALAVHSRRKKRFLRDVIALEETKGELPATTALAMIAAWRRKAEQSHVLLPCGIEKFYEAGRWKNEREWPADREKLEELRLLNRASIGSAR